MNHTPYTDTSAAFAAGVEAQDRSRDHAFNAVGEIRDAVLSWTKAQLDHAATSYYGADGVRVMRAYQLGRLSRVREQLDPSNPLYHPHHSGDCHPAS